mgnify:CR=1 FL=1
MSNHTDDARFFYGDSPELHPSGRFYREVHKREVVRRSPLTGKLNTMEIDITPAMYRAWLSGRYPIQQVLGHLTSDEREFLKTGLTPEDWDTIFSERPEGGE